MHMSCVPDTVMAHGDTEVTKNDVTDATISPPVPLITTKDGDADTKLAPNSVPGKSSLQFVSFNL
jgi:hypothetical protein